MVRRGCRQPGNVVSIPVVPKLQQANHGPFAPHRPPLRFHWTSYGTTSPTRNSKRLMHCRKLSEVLEWKGWLSLPVVLETLDKEIQDASAKRCLDWRKRLFEPTPPKHLVMSDKQGTCTLPLFYLPSGYCWWHLWQLYSSDSLGKLRQNLHGLNTRSMRLC